MRFAAFFKIYQIISDYLAEIFEIPQNFADFATFANFLLIFHKNCWFFKPFFFLLKFWDCSCAKGCKSCRAWKMLSNAYFLAKFRFDTAENEPAKNLQKFAKQLARLANFANFANPNLSKRSAGPSSAAPGRQASPGCAGASPALVSPLCQDGSSSAGPGRG